MTVKSRHKTPHFCCIISTTANLKIGVIISILGGEAEFEKWFDQYQRHGKEVRDAGLGLCHDKPVFISAS